MPPRIRLDSATWLLAALALAIAPHAQRLPAWIVLLCLGIGALRLFAVRLPARWLLISLAATVTFGVYASYGSLLGRDAGVALLSVMLTLKLLETRTLRDSMMVIIFSYFLVITHFFYSQSIPTGLYLLLVVLVITTALVGLNHPATLPPRKQMKLAAALLLQSLPVMLVLFLFFPRVPGPLWGMPVDAYSGLTGLSDSMSPGSISKLSQSGAVAFRVAFDGPAPKPGKLYWRGPVLDYFDGRSWHAALPSRASPDPISAAGVPIGYTLTLEPHNHRWLLALDMPVTLPPASHLGSTYELLADTPVRQRLRYHAISQLEYRAGEHLEGWARKRALRLPDHGNPQARELAAAWQRSASKPEEVVRQALQLFRQQAFFYTLTPPLLGSDSVDEFLFTSRRGFCEHYAGSFVFLMRAAGVPARVVTGYQGGESNPLGNYLIVRQSDAHAWAEVWLDEHGWMRVDPTAAVSPRRVESGLAAALPEGEPVPLLARIDNAWLSQLMLQWDTLNNQWNQWVLGYGQERQYDLLSRLGFEMAGWHELAIALSIGVSAVLLGIAVLMLWPREPAGDPATALYQRFCGKLARIGLARHGEEGPLDYMRRIAAVRPDLAEPVEAISALYIALRYRPNPAQTDLLRLKERVRAFKCTPP